MDVIGDAGSGDSSEIHTHIEPLRLINLIKRALTSLHQVHHLVGGLFFSGRQITNMGIRSNHQMPANVRIAIEDDEVLSAAIKNSVFGVARRVLLGLTEKAGSVLQFVWT